MSKLKTALKPEQAMALNNLGIQLEVAHRRALARAAAHLNAANTAIDPIVEWTAPNGDVLVDRKSVLLDIIATGSWR